MYVDDETYTKVLTTMFATIRSKFKKDEEKANYNENLENCDNLVAAHILRKMNTLKEAYKKALKKKQPERKENENDEDVINEKSRDEEKSGSESEEEHFIDGQKRRNQAEKNCQEISKNDKIDDKNDKERKKETFSGGKR